MVLSLPCCLQHRDAYVWVAAEEQKVHFLWPESKIPGWFSHKSEESSISINLPHPDQWYNNSYLGLAACVILEFKDIISFGEVMRIYIFVVILFTCSLMAIHGDRQDMWLSLLHF